MYNITEKTSIVSDKLTSERNYYDKSYHDHIFDGPSAFYNLAMNMSVISDKVSSHRYSEMYGTFLVPYIYKKHFEGSPIRFLEIGLGCDQAYGPGASLDLWRKLLNHGSDKIYMADSDHHCVQQHADDLKDITVLTGDQADFKNITKLAEYNRKSIRYYYRRWRTSATSNIQFL